MLEFNETAVATRMNLLDHRRQVCLANLRLRAAGMVGDLHNLNEIEGAFKIAEQIAIHALYVRSVVNHADGRATDGARDFAALFKMVQQHPPQRMGVGRLQTQGQTFVADPRGGPSEVENKAVNLTLARRIRVDAGQSDDLSCAKLSGGLDRHVQLGLKAFARANVHARPKRRTDICGSAADEATGDEAPLANARSDGDLGRRRTGREPWVLNPSKTD